MNRSDRGLYRTALACGTTLLMSYGITKAEGYEPINLVTDSQASHSAVLEDPNLVNAWGVSFSPTSPFWVSDNGAGVSTLYRVNPATDTPTIVSLVVGMQGAGNITGQAYNSLASSGAFNGNSFLFVGEDGTISGWRSSLGTTAETLATGSSGNVYKGTALDVVGGHGYLLSANFHAGTIDVLRGDAAAPNLLGSFTDPNLPSGFAPFNICELGGNLYVTYARQDGSGTDDVSGAGNGFVDAFDQQGNFLYRVGSQGTLNSPWGLAIAPASFGGFAGDLLVGNFGDGTINAFDLNGAGFVGQLPGAGGVPLTIDGLWALTTGNDNGAGSSDKLYFTAGPDGETHGLFGVIRNVPDTASAAGLLMAGLSGLFLFSRRFSR